MKTKPCRPILVTTNKKDTNLFKKHNILYYTKGMITSGGNIQAYELILISLDPDEKIEVGDVCYYENGLGGGKFLVIYTKYGTYHELNVDPIEQYGMIEGGITPLKCEIFKVIATQSQLSPEYIQQFIEEYNKGEVKDVEIVIEEKRILLDTGIDNGYEDGIHDTIYKPKLTNCFITIAKKDLPNVDFKDASLQDMYDRGFPKVKESIQYNHNLLCNMQYYMEYCQANGYITPQEWLNNHKHYKDSKEPILYTEEEVKKLCLDAIISCTEGMTSYHQDFDEWFNQNKKK